MRSRVIECTKRETDKVFYLRPSTGLAIAQPKSSAAIEIQPSSSIFKGKCHEALRDDFIQNFNC